MSARVLYDAALVYLALVYLRPTELVAGWAELPIVMIASVASAPFLAWGVVQQPRRALALPQDRLLFGYWFCITLSNVAWGWLGGALSGFTTFAQVVFQYVLLRMAIQTPRQLRGVMLLLVAAMTFHATSGIVQHVTGVGFGGVEPILSGGAWRIRSVGIFNDPNDLALALLVVIPFLVAAWLRKGDGFFVRALAFAVTLPLLLALYYTNSRGGVLGLATALAVISWRRFGRVAGTAFAVMCLTVIVALGPSRLEAIDADESSAQGRVQAWSAGLQMLKSRPLTGVGFGLYTEDYPLVAHNSFVHSFAELGFLGGTCFVGMTFWYFESLRRVARHARAGRHPLGRWHDALVATGAGFFVGLCFLSRQYNPVPYTLLALGACYVGLAEPGVREVVVSPRDRVLVLALACATIVTIWVVVRVLARWEGVY